MAARKGLPSAYLSTIKAVRIDPFYLRHVSVAAVEAKVTIKPGATFNMDELQANLNSLYASGDFQNVNHRFEQDAEGRTLVIEPVEKEWGPNYIRGGFRLSTDLVEARATSRSCSITAPSGSMRRGWSGATTSRWARSCPSIRSCTSRSTRQ
ncbi:hypothetical protein LP420_34240 [Massilia sp. B-10]|nr:hypothetical protein LP420_34240 [Massilia sp. B-10]